MLVATRYLDEVKDVNSRLDVSRNATSGLDRFDAYIEAWGSYIPEIYGVARALIAMQDSDDAARAASSDRVAAVRHGCASVVAALKKDGDLTGDRSEEEATDLLASLLSVEVWDRHCEGANWSQERYLAVMKLTARLSLTFVLGDACYRKAAAPVFF